MPTSPFVETAWIEILICCFGEAGAASPFVETAWIALSKKE